MKIKKLLAITLTAITLFISGCSGSNSVSSTASIDTGGQGTSATLAAGRDHTVTLKGDGTVWAWGNNRHGQLGDGTTTNRATPVQVVGLSGIVAVAAGDGFTVAMKNDGTVWGWGNNIDGELGDLTTTDRYTPVQVKIQSKDKDGDLEWETDDNDDPILDADGNRIAKLVAFTGVTAIAAGDGFTVALKSDGAVWTWGDNKSGQLGDGSTTPHIMPVQVAGISGVTAISAGGSDTIVLKSDGTVWGWGGNFSGELGIGGRWNLPQYTPVQAVGISGVVAIAEGDRTTMALKGDGTVWTWGGNWNGQLEGDPTITEPVDRNTPVPVQGLSGIVSISAGYSRFSMALAIDGTVWTWGAPWYGQLGDGTPPPYSSLDNHPAPFHISGLSGVTAISAGNGFAVVRKKDGDIWSWGSNSCGQLGADTSPDDYSLTPIQVITNE